MTDLDFMALDSGTLSEFLAIPVIIAAWILVVVFLDRWVRKGVGVPSDRHDPSNGHPGSSSNAGRRSAFVARTASSSESLRG
jgi:hypothetical protein